MPTEFKRDSYERTEAIKEKIRKTILSKGLGFKKGYTPWNKGIKGVAKVSEEFKQKASIWMKQLWLDPNYRKIHIEQVKQGMANPNIKNLLSALNRRKRRPMSDEHKGKISTANMGKMPSNMRFNGQYPNIQDGWYDINGKSIYFRSKWEANYALYLDWLVQQKQIEKWEFEAEKFVFEKINFGTRSYLPDFKIWNLDGTTYFVEIKGYMDSRSKTKLKRMARYFPKIKLELVQQKEYNELKRKIGKICHWT
jgi:hypothetical protein